MILIIYEADHKARAEILQTATPGSQILKAGAKPTNDIGEITTIIFWGHSGGHIGNFCGFNPDGFAAYVAEWSALQPKLKTIETISCNLVHAWDAAVELKTENSYINMAKAILAKTKAKKLSIYSMPQARSSPNNFSILLWDGGTSTWAYLAAPGGNHQGHTGGDYLLKRLEQFFKFSNFAEVAQTKDDPILKNRKIPKARVNPNFIELHEEFKELSKLWNIPSYFHVQSGSINTLRSLLVAI